MAACLGTSKKFRIQAGCSTIQMFHVSKGELRFGSSSSSVESAEKRAHA